MTSNDPAPTFAKSMRLAAAALRRVKRSPLSTLRLIRRLVPFLWLRLRGRPLIVFDLIEPGLREHIEAVADWLIRSRQVSLAVVLPDDLLERFIVTDTLKRWDGRVGCFTFSEFKLLGVVPAVTVSVHPEVGSAVARHFEGEGTRRLVMQHGLSDKAVFVDRERPDPLNDFDAVLLAGSIFREGSLKRYCARHPETCSRLRFFETGSPKTDQLFHLPGARSAIVDQLGLDRSRPTVCYAPTWEREASLEQHGIEIVRALAAMDVNVIVKLHHLSTGGAAVSGDAGARREWPAILAELAQLFPNLRLATGHDASPYLAAADVLVSDASGAAYEFMLLDRPVVFFDVPALFDLYGREGIHFWGRSAGEVVSNHAHLAVAIERALETDPYGAVRRALIPRISYARGDATQRVGQVIVTLAFESVKPRHLRFTRARKPVLSS